MKLIFSNIKNENIFEPEFQNLSDDKGTIEIKTMHNKGGIAVVYAPNGTGKSSFAKCLQTEKRTQDLSFEARNEKNQAIVPETKSFHVILDQINRNVIPGKETDYLIGRKIKREFELKDLINAGFDNAFKNSLAKTYKSEYGVGKVTDFLLEHMSKLASKPYLSAYQYIRCIVNSKDRGKSIRQDEFISFIRDESNNVSTIDLDEEKRRWIIIDCSNEKICEKIIKLDYHKIIPDADAIQIERNDDAITILKKYRDLDVCVVCDNHDFDGNALLAGKTANRERVYENLDENTKEILDKIVCNSSLIANDPFAVKSIVGKFISTGDPTELLELQTNLNTYINAICDEMVEKLLHCFSGTSMFNNYDEYKQLISEQPELDSEELLFIEDVINESVGKDITIERDHESKNYKLKIGDKDLLRTEREDIGLSSGEQNFISLAFELLLARHSSKEYIILDDPISSFDSVYKNKIAYCIVKFLEEKKQIILTHNTDLIRLLDVQLNNCFNLYILNNVEHGQNGFIPVSDEEKGLLINMHKLIQLFQNKNDKLAPCILDKQLFLMSMIPFMRGYAHISLDPCDNYGRLSNIMHGYEKGCVDVIPIYNELFGNVFSGSLVVSAEDILNLDCSNLEIINKNNYPLLAMTLQQTLVYYHLRMKVEKVLVDAFNIETKQMMTLNQIIMKAFNCSEDDPNFEKKREFKVFFTSRKTLLNEFNHFEGNMNLFQPAIDINPTSLQREIREIETKLLEVQSFALMYA